MSKKRNRYVLYSSFGAHLNKMIQYNFQTSLFCFYCLNKITQFSLTKIKHKTFLLMSLTILCQFLFFFLFSFDSDELKTRRKKRCDSENEPFYCTMIDTRWNKTRRKTENKNTLLNCRGILFLLFLGPGIKWTSQTTQHFFIVFSLSHQLPALKMRTFGLNVSSRYWQICLPNTSSTSSTVVKCEQTGAIVLTHTGTFSSTNSISSFTKWWFMSCWWRAGKKKK